MSKTTYEYFREPVPLKSASVTINYTIYKIGRDLRSTQNFYFLGNSNTISHLSKSNMRELGQWLIDQSKLIE